MQRETYRFEAEMKGHLYINNNNTSDLVGRVPFSNNNEKDGQNLLRDKKATDWKRSKPLKRVVKGTVTQSAQVSGKRVWETSEERAKMIQLKIV